MKLVKFLMPLSVALVLWVHPVHAVEPSHGTPDPHGNPAEHPTPAEGAEHVAGEGGAHGEEHGGEHAVHHYYTTDDDGDGTPNWRDPYTHDEPNVDTYVLSGVGFHLVNLLLLLGVVGYFVRRPVADTFRERALAIRTELTETARTRDEAHQRHQELLARLEKIENEVRGLDQDAEADARREEEKLVERARREAARIKEQVERNIRDESTRARAELRQDAVDLAIQLAESTLRQGVSSADQQLLARQFLDSVKGVDRV
jgi:F-type H+-transporting ATPase subunit b